MLATADLDYHLPQDRIATSPAQPRDAARLMIVRGPSREHARVRDLPSLLAPGDLLVFNTTRVLPARLVGLRADTAGRAEALYLSEAAEPRTWMILVRAKRPRPGITLRFRAPETPQTLDLTLISRHDLDPGAWVARVESQEPTLELLDRFGHTPLPPYILAARREAGLAYPDADDRDRYQTVYARQGVSVAAPTAGLHFTPDLLARLRVAGIDRTDVTLDVGPGTFKPVETETIEAHPIHAERCSMSHDAVAAVLAARGRGSRVIAVGTTCARTLESYAPLAGQVPPSLDTQLLIAPGHAWRWTDALLTNFHLPRSTLMALVAARLRGGVPVLIDHYRAAIDEGYRFYSFGDAMLVLG